MSDRLKKYLRRLALVLLSLFFITAGVNHFLATEAYIVVMPPYIPYHRFLVELSGILEIAGGVGLLKSEWRRLAGNALILLCVAVFPANVHMALNTEEFATSVSANFLYLRLPLQLALIAWILWVSRMKL